MKGLLVSCLLLIGFWLFVSGCVVRTVPYTHERVDQATEGNRGYLTGTPPKIEPEEKPPRDMLNIEIELPPHGSYEWKDNELTGNRGYVVGAPQIQKEMPAPPTEEKESRPKVLKPEAYYQPGLRITGARPVIKEKPAKEEVKLIDRYIVQEGDTLQKIAAKKEVYGNWRKWKKLFEANKEKIKDPNKIRPGMELVIPRD